MTAKSEMPDQMDLRSMDVSAKNRARMKVLFPSVFTETVNAKGELVESIDFEKLNAELGTFSDAFESRRERYGMDWPGKKDCMKLIQQPSIGTLKPCREESVNFDETENLFIEGDNLEVLKLLQKAYYGKVKMIYIDPPYNTGNEFIYPDNYSESLDTYLAYAGLVDDEGKKFSTNTPNEGRFHTKWLNMMWPRLYLARNLLREDGVIFISIDDNEVHNLRAVLNEIFGEENFIANLLWQKRYVSNATAKHISDMHDHILLYAKNSESLSLGLVERSEEQVKDYKNPDNDSRGSWRAQDLSASKPYQAGIFEITGPTGRKFNPPPGRFWRCNRETYDKWLQDNRIWFGKDNTARPMLKAFLTESQEGLRPNTWWSHQFAGHNKEATLETKSLFDGEAPFDTPKPKKLVMRMLELISDSNALSLDFFAGSGVTAQAVIEQNKHDSGNRRFILVQLPEPTGRNDYPTISDIGKERIRRAIKKLNEADGGQLSLRGPLDQGFRVFKLDRSNFKIWDGSSLSASEDEIAKQLTMHVDHVLQSASHEDILYELLLKSGFMPTEKVKQLDIASKTVFSVADGALLICLEDKITRELIDEVAKSEPMQFICLDKGFSGNDQLKANAVQTFAARNQGRDKAEQIVFRTV